MQALYEKNAREAAYQAELYRYTHPSKDKIAKYQGVSVGSYIVNNPTQALNEFNKGANQGAAIMLNQASFGQAYAKEAAQAEKDLGPTTTAWVRGAGGVATVAVIAIAAPAAGVTSGTVVLTAAGGAAYGTLKQGAQILDGNRSGFDVGEIATTAQIGAVTPIILKGIGPTAAKNVIAAGVAYGGAKG
jgi:hypothetical protein